MSPGSPRGAERAVHLHTPLPSPPDATDGPAQEKEEGFHLFLLDKDPEDGNCPRSWHTGY